MATLLTLTTAGGNSPVSFTFNNLEIPESIKWGGQQKLAVHDLIGGARVIDAMGAVPADLSWSGWFFDVSLSAGPPMSSASQRARFLDYLRISGQPLTLGWAGFNYTVLIESFSADFSAYKMPYALSCKTLQDNVAAVTAVAEITPDQAIADDMATASAAVGQINDPPLTGLMGALQTAVNAVNSFAQTSTAVANSVLVPLAALQAQVASLQANVSNTLLSVSSLGGIAPYSPVAHAAATLVNQGTALAQAPALANLAGVLGRVGQNVRSQQTGPNVITVAGGDLMQLAVRFYGDAGAWTTIARANGLSDPQLLGVQQLIIPNTAMNTGGVLNA